MEKTIIYAALYNPMIHESTYGIISLHKSLKGAEMALAFHKHATEKEDGIQYCDFMNWSVEEIEVEE